MKCTRWLAGQRARPCRQSGDYPNASSPSSVLVSQMVVNSAIPAGIPYHLPPSPGAERPQNFEWRTHFTSAEDFVSTEREKGLSVAIHGLCGAASNTLAVFI